MHRIQRLWLSGRPLRELFLRENTPEEDRELIQTLVQESDHAVDETDTANNGPGNFSGYGILTVCGDTAYWWSNNSETEWSSDKPDWLEEDRCSINR